MRVRLAGGLLTAALLAGCATTEPSATTARSEPATAGAAPPAPACEHLPEEIVPAGVDALPPLTLPCLGSGPDVALDRLTEPDDLAPLVVLLASGLADHATGTTVDVNGASYVR